MSGIANYCLSPDTLRLFFYRKEMKQTMIPEYA